MNIKRLLATALALVVVLAAAPAYSQGTFPPRGDDVTTSLGSFRIRISDQFTGLFANCPNPPYDPVKKVLSSPPGLFDPHTVIGRSDPMLDGSAADMNGVPVGSALTPVSDNMLSPPPHFGFGPNTHEVHTEVRELKMSGGGAMVRAGLWYNDPLNKTPPPRISPGEVESATGNPNQDFPASSFFDIFVRVDVPACGAGFPGATLYNTMPLIVKNNALMNFPPRVAYIHDPSSIIPILFLNTVPGKWNADDTLGWFLLAGHGVGFAQADQSEFDGIMAQQPDAQCPFSPPPQQCSPPPSPSPTPTPAAASKPAGASKTTSNPPR